MDGFKRSVAPPRPQPPVLPPPAPDVPPVSSSTPLPTEAPLPAVDMHLADPTPPLSPKGRRKKTFILLGSVLLLLMLIAGLFAWYQAQLRPVNESDKSVQRIEIKEGTSFGYVAGRLEERGIIRSSTAFRVFALLKGKQDSMKAGTCNFTPADSAQVVLDKMTAGCHDFKSVTLYPGATFETSLYAKTVAAKAGTVFKDMSIRASLRAAGYSDADITEAFNDVYDGPLFAGKPVSEGYEGYIFGETYFVAPNATAKEVLQTAFDHMYEIVKENDLETKFQAQSLTLYQGITLASIVERELDCEGKPTEERKQRCYGYQQQIARVFFNRLAAHMSLGSDVTAIYASDKLGVSSTVNVDSPYNTRVHAGLTPGPIATPGLLALRAVANPSEGNELYFLAGDDGLIYFANDDAGHEANIVNHCKLSCGDL